MIEPGTRVCQLYLELRKKGRIGKLPVWTAMSAAKAAFESGQSERVDFDTFFTDFFLDLDRRVHQPESKQMRTNAERNILCQTIDAKLERPNAERVAQWLMLSGKQPNGINMSVQGGVMIEEMCELLRELTIASASGISQLIKTEAIVLLEKVADELKSGLAMIYVHDREMAIDAMSDVDVTVNAFAHLGGFFKAAADMRVIDSLFDKLNEDGTPVIKPGGKIGKREGWEAPDLTAFAGTMPDTPDDAQPFDFRTDNAQAWARAFLKKNPGAKVDESELIGWFATAIEGTKERLLNEDTPDLGL